MALVDLEPASFGVWNHGLESVWDRQRGFEKRWPVRVAFRGKIEIKRNEGLNHDRSLRRSEIEKECVARAIGSKEKVIRQVLPDGIRVVGGGDLFERIQSNVPLADEPLPWTDGVDHVDILGREVPDIPRSNVKPGRCRSPF
jgi:hypothetical protein